MDIHHVAESIHIYALLIWVGGTITSAWTAYWATDDNPNPSQTFLASLHKTMRFVVTPGMVIAMLGGLTMLIPSWSALYAKMPWMHIKLTLALLLAGVTGILSARLRKAVKGTPQKPVVFRTLASAGSLLAALIISLVIFKPGS